MYTILIMAKETSDNLQEHYPAFRNVIESSDIGICPWIMSGQTVETALPQLYDLVDNNREWRAVVVMYDEDKLDLNGAINPYDFLGKVGKNGKVNNGTEEVTKLTLDESNREPLLRLTHFLMGAPLPSPEYDKVEVWPYEGDWKSDSPGDPYIRYRVRDEERYEKLVDKYKKWNAEHTMQGLIPSELILVTTRNVAFRKDSETIRQAWEVHNENDSSTFWRRNLYPHSSRFLVFDIEKRGKMYEERDSFRFWSSVLTLVGNDIDSNTLQPQKLYRIDVRMDSAKLSDVFQEAVKNLNLAKFKLQRSLDYDDSEKDAANLVPNYVLEVPVSFKRVRNTGTPKKTFDVTLTGGVTSAEADQWEQYTVDMYLETAEMIKDVERELEMSALSYKDRCEYKEKDVRLLDKYTEEDFGYALHDTYDEVLKAQKALPPGIVGYRDEMKAADQQVKSDIQERMSKTQLISVLGLSAVLFLLILLPALQQDSTQNEAILITAISLIAILGGGLLVAFLQKRRFHNHVRDFRSYYTKMCEDLNASSALYKGFIGHIASHIHGSSYLKTMNRKKKEAEKAVGVRKMHIGFIEEFKGRLSLWSSALRLKVDFDVLDELVLYGEDESEIDFYNLYSLSLGDGTKKIPLNDTGYPVDTPFIFAEQLRIEREEVYDDIG